MLEIVLAVLAQGADKVVGQLASLMEVAADLADIALPALGCGVLLGLDVGMIIGVGAGGGGGQDLGLHHIGDIQHLGLHVLHVDDLAGEDGVGVLGDIADAVGHALRVAHVRELVHVPPALEAEALEELVGRVLGEDGDVELSGLGHHVAGVVLLDDGDGDLLGVAGGHLSGGVDDAAVVLAVHPGGEHLHAVGKALEHIVVHIQCGGSFALLRRHGGGAEVGGDGVGQGVQLSQLVFGQGGADSDVVPDKLGVFQSGEHLPHQLAAGGRPAAVFHNGDLPALEIVVGDIVEQVLHGDEHAGVIGGGRKDQVAAAESVGQDIACRGDGGVVHAHTHASLHQLGCQNVGSVLRVSVHGGVGDEHALFLGRVAAPLQIFLQKIAEMLAPHRAVEGADIGDIQSGGLFQHGLDLGAVFAHDVGVIAAGLVKLLAHKIALVGEKAAVQRAEGAESVGGKEDLVRLVVGHHDLGPVDHGGVDKGQLMLAHGEAVPFLHHMQPSAQIQSEELSQHGLDLGVADDLRLRVAQAERLNGCGVVRLHVGDEQVVQLPSVQGVGHIFEKDSTYSLIHRVEQNRFLVQQQIGVIGDAVGYAVNALEAGKPSVVGAYPDQIVQDLSCAVHECSSSKFNTDKNISYCFLFSCGICNTFML